MKKQAKPYKLNRVCMFTNLYPPIVSGSSTQSSFLARELISMGKEVTVITSRVHPDSLEYECINGVHVHRLPCIRLPRMQIALNFPWLNSSFVPGNMKRIMQIVEKQNPDVLHLHNHMFDMAFRAVSIRSRLKIPLVITIHTMIKHSQNLYNLLLYPADRIFLNKSVIHNADAIVSPDYNIREYVRDAFKTQKDHVVLYGIESPIPPPSGQVQKLIDRYKLSGKRVILSIGHVHKIRDRKDLVKAMPLVLKKIPNAILLIVGTVATEIPVRIARELGIEQSVIFTGSVPHADLGAYLSVAELEAHWLNQDDPENTSLGVASLECMAAGKAVVAVASEATYGDHVLKNGKNVLLIDSTEPEKISEIILKIINDDIYKQTIGQSAMKTIEQNFSWNKIASDTLIVYHQAIRTFHHSN
jgi:1,2-diacylglycerol 3-alpha-glucosyltransferase